MHVSIRLVLRSIYLQVMMILLFMESISFACMGETVVSKVDCWFGLAKTIPQFSLDWFWKLVV